MGICNEDGGCPLGEFCDYAINRCAPCIDLLSPLPTDYCLTSTLSTPQKVTTSTMSTRKESTTSTISTAIPSTETTVHDQNHFVILYGSLGCFLVIKILAQLLVILLIIKKYKKKQIQELCSKPELQLTIIDTMENKQRGDEFLYTVESKVTPEDSSIPLLFEDCYNGHYSSQMLEGVTHSHSISDNNKGRWKRSHGNGNVLSPARLAEQSNYTVQSGDVVVNTSQPVQHSVQTDGPHFDISTLYTATQKNLASENDPVAEGIANPQQRDVTAKRDMYSFGDVLQMKEDATPSDKRRIKELLSVRQIPSISHNSGISGESETSVKQPCRPTGVESADSGTVAEVNMDLKKPESAGPLSSMQQQPSVVQPSCQEADPMTTSGVRKPHPNQRIYDILKGIDWVEDYYSEGQSIEVYCDLRKMSPDVAMKELVERTGATQDKFYLMQESCLG